MKYVGTTLKRGPKRTQRNAGGVPLLTPERELELARCWRDNGDVEAMHELVESHSRLALSVANRFRRYGVPVTDLVQEAHIGLIQAADRFDPERGVRFSTCAIWWIRAAVQDYVLRNWSVVRTSTTASQKSLFFGLARYRARLARKGESAMTSEQRGIIARSLGISAHEVEKMEHRLGANDQSLHAPLYEDGTGERQDFIVDGRPGPEEETLESRERESQLGRVRRALRSLNPRERRIIRARHLAKTPLTLAQLGSEMGVSKERVRQIEHRALDKLRAKVLARDRAFTVPA